MLSCRSSDTAASSPIGDGVRTPRRAVFADDAAFDLFSRWETEITLYSRILGHLGKTIKNNKEQIEITLELRDSQRTQYLAHMVNFLL